MLLFVPSCSSGPKLVELSGTVTLDGTPLADGDITIVPTAAGQAPQATKIVDGKFELKVLPGSHTVKIEATRELPKKGEFSFFESIIPERYNTKSELKVEVPDTGKTDAVFELKSDPKKK